VSRGAVASAVQIEDMVNLKITKRYMIQEKVFKKIKTSIYCGHITL